MSTRPKISRLLLFKQGLAHVERRGPAEALFELPFGRGELSEALRTVAVRVMRGDARVIAVSFDTLEDPDATLAERKLRFDPGAALRGLLHAGRGRRVRVDAGDGALEGEVVGVEESPGGQGPPRRWLLLRTAPSKVAVLDLAGLRALEVQDEGLQQSLAVLIDRGRAAAAGEGRTLRVSLTERAEDLSVSYVVPCAPFRISYRLLCEGLEAHLSAFALVHNPLEEELDGVELRLTTAQPASLGSDARNRAPERQGEDRTEPAGKFDLARRGGAQPATVRAAATVGTLLAMGAPTPERLEETMMSGTEAELPPLGGPSIGELMDFRAPSPVSMPRRGAALVPLLSTPVRARKERIWRDGSGTSPDVILHFSHEGSAPLEEGPCAVYEGGVYAGEALLPAATPGSPVELSFARDLGVRCRRATHEVSSIAGLTIDPGGIVEQQRREDRHVVTIESDHGAPVEVIVELTRKEGRKLAPGSVQPFERTATAMRFRVQVAPRGAAVIEVREQGDESQRFPFEEITRAQLEMWRAEGLLSEEKLEVIASVLLSWEEARALEAQRTRLEREQQDAYTKQGKMAEQLAVLRDVGPEGALRVRYVNELQVEQDKINALEAEMRRAREAANEKRRSAQGALIRLSRG
jgi:hypothetical protein